MSTFDSEHFTTCLLTRIYNSTLEANPGVLPDLSKAQARASLIKFIEAMPAKQVSSTIFNAVHFPGSLDRPVDLPKDLVDQVSALLTKKYEGEGR